MLQKHGLMEKVEREREEEAREGGEKEREGGNR